MVRTGDSLRQLLTLMLLLRRCLRHSLQLTISPHSPPTRSVSCHSKKSEAISRYEQLLREHAPLISYLDRSTTHDFTLVLSSLRLSDFNSNVSKGPSEENSSEDAEGVRKRKENRNLRIALEQFRTLKAVSRTFGPSTAYSSAAVVIRRDSAVVRRSRASRSCHR
jgi:hypothetical protein